MNEMLSILFGVSNFCSLMYQWKYAQAKRTVFHLHPNELSIPFKLNRMLTALLWHTPWKAFYTFTHTNTCMRTKINGDLLGCVPYSCWKFVIDVSLLFAQSNMLYRMRTTFQHWVHVDRLNPCNTVWTCVRVCVGAVYCNAIELGSVRLYAIVLYLQSRISLHRCVRFVIVIVAFHGLMDVRKRVWLSNKLRSGFGRRKNREFRPSAFERDLFVSLCVYNFFFLSLISLSLFAIVLSYPRLTWSLCLLFFVLLPFACILYSFSLIQFTHTSIFPHQLLLL